jgi:hypothetical protein
MPRDVGKYLREFIHPQNLKCYTVQCSTGKKKEFTKCKDELYDRGWSFYYMAPETWKIVQTTEESQHYAHAYKRHGNMPMSLYFHSLPEKEGRK